MTPFPFPPAPVPGGFTSLMPSGMPVGSVIAFAGGLLANAGDPPEPGKTFVDNWGWLVCDGRRLAVHDYAFLYEAIGSRYDLKGDTDPDKFFRLPDYRGYFLRMVNGTSGVDPDTDLRWLPDGTASKEVGSLQYCALQNHVHGYTMPSADAQVTAGNDAPAPVVPNSGPAKTDDPDPLNSDPSKGLSDHETRPVNMYVYYLIKYL